MIRKVIHRSFVPRTSKSFMLKSYESIAEETRREAEAFVNEVGAKNALAITEKTWHEGFTVTVWSYIP